MELLQQCKRRAGMPKNRKKGEVSFMDSYQLRADLHSIF